MQIVLIKVFLLFPEKGALFNFCKLNNACYLRCDCRLSPTKLKLVGECIDQPANLQTYHTSGFNFF